MDTFALESKVHALNIVKTIARNMGVNFFDYVEPIAQLCLEKLMNDRLNTAVRVQSAKCMRFMVGACEEQPEKMKQLFLMSYAKLVQELEYFVPKQKVMEVNVVLKELFKHMRTCEDLKDKGVTLFTVQEAFTLVDRLKAIYDMIVSVTQDVIKKAGNLDEEDMATLLEEVQRIDKGKYFIMQISGCLLGNMGKTHPEVSAKVGDVLLPPYAATLLNLEEKQEYEITDAVCMLDDCLERGDQALFEKIAIQAGAKLIEVIQHAGQD